MFKKIVGYIVIPIILVGIGFLNGVYYLQKTTVESLLDNNSTQLFRQLLFSSEVEITENHCDIPARGEQNILYVSDFLVSYMEFSFSPKKDSYVRLECGAHSKNVCTFSFGQEQLSEGWNRILVFSYNFEQETIDQSSFECIDVP